MNIDNDNCQMNIAIGNIVCSGKLEYNYNIIYKI